MKTTPCKCISVILFFCLSCLLLNGCNSQTAGQQSADQANQEAQRQEVSFIIAEKTALTDFSELPGRLNSFRVAQIRARVPGVILHQVQGGMDVKKGQLLFSLDPKPLEAAYESAAANLQKSLALQTQVQIKADRFKSLVEFNAVSKQDYIDANAAAHSASAEVANAFINERALDERLDIALQTQKSQQATYDLASKIYEFGNSSALDLRIAETQMETANAQVTALQRLRAQAENALALLVGATLPEDLPPAQSLDHQLIVTDLQAGLPSELLTRRPDIRQAESLLKAANANIGAARAAFFSSIRLTSSFGRASSELNGLFTSGSNLWNFSPELSLPIFDAGFNKANLKLAEVQKDINIARYEKVIKIAFREVADAMAANTMLSDEVKAQQRLVNAEQARFKLAELRYQNGVDSMLSVLDAQRSLYIAQQSLIELRQSKLTALVTLYKALGGGAS